MKKETIIAAVCALRDSAKARGTEQGVVVYARVLQMLESAETSKDVEDVRIKLNQALMGIEAHGDLTDAEFTIVRKLRE
jgi:pectate lyase